MKRVLIVGSRGQDGSLLRDLHTGVGDPVVGLDVDGVSGLNDAAPVNLTDRRGVLDFVRSIDPQELYYLAAHHHSSEEVPNAADEMKHCSDVHVVGLVNMLEALRACAPACRLFYAGSSQMFGNPSTPRQNESTPLLPRNPYAITKVAGAHACALYRERFGLHASVGILYNHESRLRGPRFVTQRIVRGAREAARDKNAELRLGSLSAVVDWGWAPDYVDAMKRIVNAPEPGDYVVATGEPHTVRDFAELAYAAFGLDYRHHVREDSTILTHSAPMPLVGDATKLRTVTGWKPTVMFAQMVELLARE